MPTPTKEGYTFKGWAVSNTSTEYITSSTIANITSDQVLYAIWDDGRLYLYKYGDECTSITGGWNVGARESNGQAEKKEDHMYLYRNSSTLSTDSYCGTVNNIDMSGYSKLVVHYKKTQAYSSSSYGVLFVSYGSPEGGYSSPNTNEGEYTEEIPIVSSPTTIFMHSYSDYNCIYEVYLKK